MNPNDLIHFCAPQRLVMGCGTRSQLPALVHRLGLRRGLLVTDPFFTGHTPWVQEYVQAAEALGLQVLVFDGGAPDPTTVLCDDATRTVRAQTAALQASLREGEQAIDHVIALGGGSNIDLAKALCLTVPTGRPVRDFVGGLQGAKPLPLIAVPTTAGTGSEATPGAILVDPSSATKVAVMDNALRPQVALIDPELTYGCPARLTGDAGIDAFTHAIESYLTIDSADYDRQGDVDPGYSGRSSLTMLFAAESMRLCARWMLKAYHQGDSREARVGMAYASVYAALSYGTAGLNAGHGLAYAVAGLTHQSHGSTNAVMLPYVLDEIAAVRAQEFVDIAAMLGLGTLSREEAALRVPELVRDWVAALGIPSDLRSFGVQPVQLEGLIADGLAVTRLAKAFAVPDVAVAYQRIVRAAFEGRLRGDA